MNDLRVLWLNSEPGKLMKGACLMIMMNSPLYAVDEHDQPSQAVAHHTQLQPIHCYTHSSCLQVCSPAQCNAHRPHLWMQWMSMTRPPKLWHTTRSFGPYTVTYIDRAYKTQCPAHDNAHRPRLPMPCMQWIIIKDMNGSSHMCVSQRKSCASTPPTMPTSGCSG
jgi:hypothetical protein